ncbi:MAG: peptidoglycan editing factor PgeF [Chloroflexota bacterium]
MIRDDIPYFRFESLADHGRLTHAIFTRLGGVSPAPFDSLNLSVSVPDERTNVYANRALAYGTHGRHQDTLVHAHLQHGAAVARVTQEDHGRLAGKVDGLITDEPGCGLTMNFADCAPILLYDPVQRAIGLGHAGWQGAVKDLPGAIVRAMREAFGSRPADLLAGIGPCIGPCCYEVGETVITAVRQAFLRQEGLLVWPVTNGRPHFDLPAANHHCLERAGVEQIELSGLCTACRTDLFYSHRAEKGQTGRFGALFILPG